MFNCKFAQITEQKMTAKTIAVKLVVPSLCLEE